MSLHSTLLQALGAFVAAVLLNRAPAHTHEARIRGDTLEVCAAREVSRKPLVVSGGRRLYVQPLVLEANSRGDALIAGELNYLFEPYDGGWRRTSSDRVFGALVPHDGPARIVPSPVPNRLLSGIRAIARDDDSWAVLFGETRPYSGAFRPDTITRLWFGIFDGTRWRSLEQIPLPPSGTIRSQIVTRLVQYGDTLGFATRIRSADHQSHVVVFERGREGWSYEIVRTQFGSYLALAHSDTLGLVLAAVQPDPTLRRDGNSLLLWNRGARWKRLRTAALSADGAVHRPYLSISPHGGVLSWVVAAPGPQGMTYEARTMVGRPEERSEPVVSLDASVSRSREPYSVELRGGRRVWVLDHVEAGADRGEIRFVQSDGGSVSVFGRLPNPFATAFIGAAPSDSTILLTGGGVDAGHQAVTTLLLRVHVQCSRAAAR